jgi:hypothetical protein
LATPQVEGEEARCFLLIKIKSHDPSILVRNFSLMEAGLDGDLAG